MLPDVDIKQSNVENQSVTFKKSQNEFSDFVKISRQTLQRMSKLGLLVPCKDGNAKNSPCYYTERHLEKLPAALCEYEAYKKNIRKKASDDKGAKTIAAVQSVVLPFEELRENVADKPEHYEAKNFLPMTITPIFDAIPQFLKVLPRWVCWRLIPADKKNKKVPMSPKDGRLINTDVTNPENWMTFDEAQSWYQRGECSGIGFALTNTPPKVCCVDVDHCFNTDGSLNETALAVIETCQNSFTEKSQSGEGIHCWFIDEDFHGGRKKDPVEVYAVNRFIAMSGVHVQSSSAELKTVNGTCLKVIDKFIGSREENLFDKTARTTDNEKFFHLELMDTAPLSDADRKLVEYFQSESCKQSDLNIFDLFNGHTDNYFQNTGKPFDDSVADCALLTKILYYVGGAGTDPEIGQRALKIFGQSELAKRSKWIQREDYRLDTLNAAFNYWNKDGRKNSGTNNAGVDASKIEQLKAELRSVMKALADFNTEKNSVLEKLRSVEKFDSKTVFSEDILQAAAFAKLFDKPAFSNFRREVKNYGDKHKEEKVSVNDWLAEVKDKAAEISCRRSDLLTTQNQIQAQINSTKFAARNDVLKNFSLPEGYSISDNGIGKIVGEQMITVCRRPVIITGKIFDVAEKIYKFNLAYMTKNKKWQHLPPIEAATVFDRNRLVQTANLGLPVTSSNANLLVDFLDAFNAENEEIFPITQTTPRCGWYTFGDKDYFIDPRRDSVIADEEKNISVKVDDLRSEFSRHLQQVGSLDEWKKAYQLAKKSPVARLMVAANVAPPLLKVLGERNFLLHICAPTRAGKTTGLLLGASAVGNEKIIRSFDATRNGLAGAAADVNDYAFLIDEKQVADSRLKEQFDNLVYALANGIGRTKLNKNSTVKDLQIWRTIAISTGETLMLPDTVTGGANTRLLTLATKEKILDAATCKEIREIITENFGFAFNLVIDKIFELGKKKLRNYYKDITETFTETFPELLPEHCRYMAIMTVADTLLNSALFGNTVQSFDGEYIKAIDDAVLSAAEIFPLIPTTDEIADTPREKEFVLNFIAQNQSRFIGGNIPLERMQSIYGKLDAADGFTYIAASALKNACKAEGFDYRKLVTDLIADEFIIPADTIEHGRKSPRSYVKQRLGEISPWCYRIKHSVLGG